MTYNKYMKDLTTEKQEAICAGNRALRSLEAVHQELCKAGNWGLLDMFGGGTFTSFIKHTKINNASNLLYQARRDIEDFQRELKDVLFINPNLNINISGLLTFLDFFSDDILSDYLVQRQITKARKETETAIDEVKTILDCL